MENYYTRLSYFSDFFAWVKISSEDPESYFSQNGELKSVLHMILWIFYKTQGSTQRYIPGSRSLDTYIWEVLKSCWTLPFVKTILLLYHSSSVPDHPLFSSIVFYNPTAQNQISTTCKEGIICVYALRNSTLTQNKQAAYLCCLYREVCSYHAVHGKVIVLCLKFHRVGVTGSNLCIAVQKQTFVVCDPVKHLHKNIKEIRKFNNLSWQKSWTSNWSYLWTQNTQSKTMKINTDALSIVSCCIF